MVRINGDLTILEPRCDDWENDVLAIIQLLSLVSLTEVALHPDVPVVAPSLWRGQLDQRLLQSRAMGNAAPGDKQENLEKINDRRKSIVGGIHLRNEPNGARPEEGARLGVIRW